MEKNEIHKLSWLSSILKHGKWYMLSSIASKGINILVLRIYTEYLTPKDFGILDTLNSIALLLPFFISLYLDSAFGRFFHDYKNDKRKISQLFSTIFFFVSIYGSILIILVIFTSSYWVKGFLEIPIMPHIFLAFIPPLFFQIGNLGLVFLRQSLLSKHTTVVEVGTVIINIGVAIPLLVIADYGILAKLFGNFFSSISIFIFYLIYFLRKGLLKLTFNKKMLIESLNYSVPLFPIFAGTWISGLSDRLVIAKYISLESVGLYAVGFMIGKLLYVIQDATTQVIGPISMSGLIYEKEKTKIKIAETSFYLWVILLYLNFGMFLFAKELVWIFAEKAYSEAYYIIPIIGFSYVVGSQQRIFATIISFHKSNWILSTGGIIQAITNLGLNIIFVPIFGYQFAAYSTVIAVIFYAIWLFYWAQKKDNINYNLSSYLVTSLVIILFCFLSFLVLDYFFLRILIYLVCGLILLKYSLER